MGMRTWQRGDGANRCNMIIPQIAENLTKSGNIKIPGVCPVCGEKTGLRSENGVKTLHCLNADCPAKRIKSFALFVSRNAMDIEGLSEATLQKFISRGIGRFPKVWGKTDRI